MTAASVLSQPSASADAGVADFARGNKPIPDEQDDHRSHGRAYQPGALVEAIPSNGLADESCKECADDAQDGGQDEAGWIVWAGSEQARNDARQETDDDDPKDVHDDLSRELVLYPLAQAPYASAGKVSIPPQARDPKLRSCVQDLRPYETGWRKLQGAMTVTYTDEAKRRPAGKRGGRNPA